MRSRRWTGWIAGLLPAAVCAQLLLGSALPGSTASPALTALTAPTAPFISSPRESLPAPVHDEATCAFCQAAAFAPHGSRPETHLALATGDEQRVHVFRDDRLTSTASAGPARSRAPPAFRSV